MNTNMYVWKRAGIPFPLRPLPRFSFWNYSAWYWEDGKPRCGVAGAQGDSGFIASPSASSCIWLVEEYNGGPDLLLRQAQVFPCQQRTAHAFPFLPLRSVKYYHRVHKWNSVVPTEKGIWTTTLIILKDILYSSTTLFIII